MSRLPPPRSPQQNTDERDKRGLALVRAVERRIVWLVAATAAMIIRENPSETADQLLSDYEHRFDMFDPSDLP